MLHILLIALLVYGGESGRSIVHQNDTALEYLNNCKCVSEIYCYNGVMNVRGIGILSIRNNGETQKETMRIQCSKPSEVCCKDNPEEKVRVRNEVKVISTETPDSVTVTGPNTNLKNNNSNGKCGKQKPSVNVRIFSASGDISAAIDGEFPWMTSIFKKNELDGSFKFRCAGSLISDSVVLTAAHCVYSARKKPSTIRVSANAKIVLKSIGDDENHEREVSKIIVHPDYYAGGGHNDIALLILQRSYNESRQLNNICLPDGSSNYSRQNCIATGWGAVNREINLDDIILRKVEVPIMDRNQCEALLRKSKLGNNFVLHESFICAGGEKDKDTCKGDGGGPLICPDEGGHYSQMGIVSWGVDCGRRDLPGVYTDVQKFVSWIKTNTQQNFPRA